MNHLTTRTGQKITVGQLLRLRNDQTTYRLEAVWRRGQTHYAAIYDTSGRCHTVVTHRDIKAKLPKERQPND